MLLNHKITYFEQIKLLISFAIKFNAWCWLISALMQINICINAEFHKINVVKTI